MKARVEQAWIRVTEDGVIGRYEVVVRVDARKGKFIESIYRRHEDARSRVRELLRMDTVVELGSLTPTA